MYIFICFSIYSVIHLFIVILIPVALLIAFHPFPNFLYSDDQVSSFPRKWERDVSLNKLLSRCATNTRGNFVPRKTFVKRKVTRTGLFCCNNSICCLSCFNSGILQTWNYTIERKKCTRNGRQL